MMESQRYKDVFPGLISVKNEGGSKEEQARGKYRHHIDKIRNEKVGNSVAWEEFLPIMEYILPDRKLSPKSLHALRSIFGFKRLMYLKNLKTLDSDIGKLVSDLHPEERPQISDHRAIIDSIFPKKSPK
jgi:hypothetical protein